MTLHARPCLYCVVLLSALFTSSCIWEPVQTSYLLEKYDAVLPSILQSITISTNSGSEKVTLDASALKAEVATGKTRLTRMVDRCWCNSGYSLVETPASRRGNKDSQANSNQAQSSPSADSLNDAKDSKEENSSSSTASSDKAIGRPRDSLTYFRSLFSPYNTTVWELHSLIIHVKNAQERAAKEAEELKNQTLTLQRQGGVDGDENGGDGKENPGGHVVRTARSRSTRWQKMFSVLRNQVGGGNSAEIDASVRKPSGDTSDGQEGSSKGWISLPSLFVKRSHLQRHQIAPHVDSRIQKESPKDATADEPKTLDNSAQRSWWKKAFKGPESKYGPVLKPGNSVGSETFSQANTPHSEGIQNPVTSSIPQTDSTNSQRNSASTTFTKSKSTDVDDIPNPLKKSSDTSSKSDTKETPHLTVVQRLHLVLRSTVSVCRFILNPINFVTLIWKATFGSITWLVKNINRQNIGNFFTKDHDLRQYGIGAVVDFRWGR
ncbi:hypothetical protein FRC02_000197 [Tulasnella sp. 418]|nr:hypothetical protein FRC02_000197 [Tulasnella sp. 418]